MLPASCVPASRLRFNLLDMATQCHLQPDDCLSIILLLVSPQSQIDYCSAGGRSRFDERGSSEIPDPAGAGAAGLAGQRRRKGLSRSCPGVNPGTRYLPAAESTPNTRMPPPMLPLGDTQRTST